MADIKNFSLVGVGSKLQFGKAGAKLFQANDAFAFKKANEATLANVEVAEPIGSTHATTKSYVDTAIGALSSSRILDSKTNTTTMVATDEATGEVTIDAKGVSDLATRVATFKSGTDANTSLTVDNSAAGATTLQVESSEVDADLHLMPKGDGEVVIGNGTGLSTIITADDGASLMLSGGAAGVGGVGGDLILRGGVGTTSGNIVFQTGDDLSHTKLVFTPDATSRIELTNGTDSFSLTTAGEATDIDLSLAPKGAGQVNVNNAVVANVATGVVSTDAVNVGQLNNAITTAAVGSIVTREITMSTATMNIGTPIKGHVRRVFVKITTAYSAGAQITVGSAAGPAELVDSYMVDESSVGVYDMNVDLTYAIATQLVVTVTGGPAVGAATLVVEYIQG